MPDVYLLTEGKEGDVAVPHLTLTFLDSGLALDKADGEAVWDSPWGGLEEMAPVERSVLPDGRDGVVIVVVERGETRGLARTDRLDHPRCAGDDDGPAALGRARRPLLRAGCPSGE